MGGPLQALVSCAPGLERALLAELRALKVRRARRVESGAVLALMSTSQLYAANAFLRCASRVLVKACGFRATSFSQLEAQFLRCRHTLEPFLPSGASISVKVHSRQSKLYHSGAISERMTQFIEDFFPCSSTGEQAETLITVMAERDEFTVRVDSSGEPLYKRSWHMSGAKMPMRQSVAAGILNEMGWASSRSVPFIDPFCGSGTLPIEAAHIYLGHPPHKIERSDTTAGDHRTFALQQWPSFEPGTWAVIHHDAQRREHAAAQRRREMPPILASDRDPVCVAVARKQASGAGVDDLIEIHQRCVSDLRPPQASLHRQGLASTPYGMLVTNLPWGVRSMRDSNLHPLYSKFGAIYRSHFRGWKLGALVEDCRLAKAIMPQMECKLRLRSGAINCSLMALPDSHSQTA